MPENPDYIITDVSHLEGSQLHTGWLRVDMIPMLLCRENPKLHDLQKLWEGIARDGFIDHAKLDSNLTNMNGEKLAFVYGNGRNEALYHGWQQWQLGEHDTIPEGIKYDDDYWYIPVSFGLDAKSEAQAQDILLFHNSSTMLGGDYQDSDIWHLYDKSKLAQMGQAMINDNEGEFEPLSMDSEEIEDLLHYLSGNIESDNDNESDNQADNSSQSTKEITCPHCGEIFTA